MAKRKKTPDILTDQPEVRPIHGDSDPQAIIPTAGQTQATPEPSPTQPDPFAVMFRQESPPPLPFSVTVKLTVSGPERLRRAATGYLAQAFQALHDTTVVEKEAEWELAVLGTEIETARVGAYGVALSAVVLRTGHLTSGESGSSLGLSRSPMPSSFSEFRGMWLRVAAAMDLRRQCQEIVADFDETHLEASRRSRRQAPR